MRRRLGGMNFEELSARQVEAFLILEQALAAEFAARGFVEEETSGRTSADREVRPTRVGEITGMGRRLAEIGLPLARRSRLY